MIRLFFKIYGRLMLFVGQRLLSTPGSREFLVNAIKVQFFLGLFLIIGIFFWGDVLSLVGLVYLACHTYRLRHRDDWI